MSSKGKVQGGLYPTIAVSDAFMAACHVFAATKLFEKGKEEQAHGFLIVALACTAGVLRFGLSETYFAAYNQALAALAGRLGLPLVGYVQWKALGSLPPQLNKPVLTFVIAMTVLTLLTMQMSEETQALYSLVQNLACFVAPLALTAFRNNDLTLGCGVGLFVFFGAVVGPDRHRSLFGVRRENLFHYGLGCATLLISNRL